jgi:hypothetical protein
MLEIISQEGTRNQIIQARKDFLKDKGKDGTHSKFPDKGSLKEIILHSQIKGYFGARNDTFVILRDRLKWIDDTKSDKGIPTKNCPIDFASLWNKLVLSKDIVLNKNVNSERTIFSPKK